MRNGPTYSALIIRAWVDLWALCSVCFRRVNVAAVMLIATAALAFEPLKVRLYIPAGSGERAPTKLIQDSSLKRLSPTHRRRLFSAAIQFGDAGLTTVLATTDQQGSGNGWSNTALSLPIGTSIYGAFEAGFSSQQDRVITEQFGCSTPSSCYSDGGWDTRFAQGACAGQCGITLPRWENGRLYSFADTCGGHTVCFQLCLKLCMSESGCALSAELPLPPVNELHL